jgi:hypothetical protein
MNRVCQILMLVLALLAGLWLAGGSTAHASHSVGPLADKPGLPAIGDIIVASGISSSRAAQIAQGRYGGEVLRVKKRGSVYQVKLRTSGGVIVVCVSSSSGQIVGC